MPLPYCYIPGRVAGRGTKRTIQDWVRQLHTLIERANVQDIEEARPVIEGLKKLVEADAKAVSDAHQADPS